MRWRPAEIARVIIDEENRAMEVIVPDDFLSVAIGKRGQNVRLASKLTGWHLDVNSETQYNEAMQSGYESLKQIVGIGTSMADTLFEKGFHSAEEVANAEIDDLVQIRGIGEEKAGQLIASARLAHEQIKQAVEQEDKETDEVDQPQEPVQPDTAGETDEPGEADASGEDASAAGEDEDGENPAPDQDEPTAS